MKRASKLRCYQEWLFGLEPTETEVDREFKLQVCGKRQTSDSSWEFLKTENEQIKTDQNISYA